jgi:polyisoprenoid-binding protein YceI
MGLASSSAAERPAARTRTWHVDPSRSTVELGVKHVWGRSTVSGRFTRFDGTYTLGEDGARIELDADARSLDTGNRWRDRHLRDIALLHVERHPHVRFTSERIRELGNGKLWVDGELAAAGRTIPVSFEASRREVGAELELAATTTVDEGLLGKAYGAVGALGAAARLHVLVRLTPA